MSKVKYINSSPHKSVFYLHICALIVLYLLAAIPVMHTMQYPEDIFICLLVYMSLPIITVLVSTEIIVNSWIASILCIVGGALPIVALGWEMANNDLPAFDSTVLGIGISIFLIWWVIRGRTLSSHTDKEMAPLKWYTFSRCVRIPLGVIILLSAVLQLCTTSNGNFSGYGVIVLILSVVSIILMITAAIGLYQYAPYGWYCYIASLVTAALLSAITVVLTYVWGFEVTSQIQSDFIAQWFIYLIEWVYFWKRRDIFFEDEDSESDYNETREPDTLKEGKKDTMSSPKTMTVKCSKCGKPINATVFESVNTDYAANVAQKIINGELFDVKCSSCGTVSHLEYDVLYHDLNHAAMIMVLHKNSESYNGRVAEIRSTIRIYENTRIVHDMNSLKEKVECLEQNRDDRIIELSKVYAVYTLLAKRPDFKFSKAYYGVNNNKERFYLYDVAGEEVTCELPDNTYKYIKELYESSVHSKGFDNNYAIVDYNWAEPILQDLLEMAMNNLKSEDNMAEVLTDVKEQGLDADFGLVPNNPVYFPDVDLKDGEPALLKQLYIAPGAKPTWKKTQSLAVEGIPGIVDEYEMYVPSGDLYKKIYINASGEKRSTKVPAGFGIRDLAKETVKIEKVVEPKVEQKTVYQYVPRKKTGIIVTLIIFLLCIGGGGYFIYDGYSKYESMQDLCRETMADRNEIVNSYNELLSENETLKQGSAEVEELYKLVHPKGTLKEEYLKAINQYDSLYTKYTELKNEYNDLVVTKNALGKIFGFNPQPSYSDFYASKDILILGVGEEKKIDITLNYYNTSVEWEWDDSSITSNRYGDWYKDGNTFPLYIKGLSVGSNIYTFSNTSNDEVFEVLVIVTK